VSVVIFGISRMAAGRASRPSTLIALVLAAAAALAGAVLWGLAALVFHRQLSLIGLLIGLGAGLAVARYRPGSVRTIVAGAVIAVIGCALGTFLAIVFSLLHAGVSVSTITGHLSTVLHAYPGAVGWLGLLFWLIAAFAAVRVPLRAGSVTQSAPRDAGPVT
jgi:hypothetical protein